MTNTKITKKMALEVAIKSLNAETDVEVIEKLKGMIAQLEKKSGGERKPTANQVANETFKTAILGYLEDKGSALTVSEMIKEIPEVADLTNQRVSAIVRQLVADNKVIRTEEKRKAYFSFNYEVAE